MQGAAEGPKRGVRGADPTGTLRVPHLMDKGGRKETRER